MRGRKEKFALKAIGDIENTEFDRFFLYFKNVLNREFLSGILLF